MSLLREILYEVMSRSVGCTEVAAVALAAATAYKATGGVVDQVKVLLDSNTLKNTMAVAIPNTGGETGIGIAAALGALYGNPELKLNILKDISPEDTKIAKKMVYQNKTQVDIRPDQFPIYIDATVETSLGRGRAIIKGSHTNVIFVEANGEVKLGDKSTAKEPREIVSDTCNKLLAMKIPQIINLIVDLKPKDIQFLLEGAEMNMAIATEGLSKRSGLAAGANLQDLIKKGLILNDVANEAKILTAGAVDARMSGSSLPVTTNTGSGNQGIATVLPIITVSKMLKSNQLEVARALALGHLLAAYTRLKIGKLSTICGSSVAAPIGASSGILWLMGKREEAIDRAVKTIIGTIAGIFCDGAKESCALKLATASEVAVKTALLTLQNIEVPNNGIIAGSAEETINNLSLISKSMRKVDHTVLDIMLNKVQNVEVEKLIRKEELKKEQLR